MVLRGSWHFSPCRVTLRPHSREISSPESFLWRKFLALFGGTCFRNDCKQYFSKRVCPGVTEQKNQPNKIKTANPLNICLCTGSESSYTPLLLLTPFGQILLSVNSLAKLSLMPGMQQGPAVLCLIWFCFLIAGYVTAPCSCYRQVKLTGWVSAGTATPCLPTLTGLTSASQECQECCHNDSTYFPCKEERLGMITVCHGVVPLVCNLRSEPARDGMVRICHSQRNTEIPPQHKQPSECGDFSEACENLRGTFTN